MPLTREKPVVLNLQLAHHGERTHMPFFTEAIGTCDSISQVPRPHAGFGALGRFVMCPFAFHDREEDVPMDAVSERTL